MLHELTEITWSYFHAQEILQKVMNITLFIKAVDHWLYITYNYPVQIKE